MAGNAVGTIVASEQFDVFVSHNSANRSAVIELCDGLRRHDISPWVDLERIRPGTWIQDALSSAIRSSRAVALVIGPQSVGPWQMTEFRLAIDRYITEGIPLIPVLLPDVAAIPDDIPFLRLLKQVRFVRSLSEEPPLRDLIWSITGERP